MNVLYKTSLNCAGLCAVVAASILKLCFKFLGKTFLTSLHFAYSCYIAIEIYIHRLIQVKRFLRTINKTDLFFDCNFIRSRVSKLEKIPRHLTVINGLEATSYQDYVKLIQWCKEAGIQHISFYDHRNVIDCEELYEAVCQFSKHLIPHIKWGKSFTEDIKEFSKTQINGYMWKPLINVHVYKREDGLDLLIKSTEDVIASVKKPLSVKDLDTFHKKYFLAPDPDLALVCGDVLSCFGFPPWCLRVTQFQQITSHHNLPIELFIEQIEDFSGCKQRWGR